LVLTDVDMPRMGGIELAALIKKDPKLKDVSVMIVSYKEKEEDRIRGMEAGADYYLAKGNFHDETLVRAVLDGDEHAFAEIFDRHKSIITRVVSRFFRDRSEIEEFVQQAFTKTYFSLDKFRGGRGDSFPAWVTRIAINVCYDEFRRRSRRGESNFSDLDDGEVSFAESVVE